MIRHIATWKLKAQADLVADDLSRSNP